MKSFIKQRLREAISASEAHRDEHAIQTVIDGKRDIGFITLIGTTLGRDNFWDLVKKHKLKTIKVPSNDYDAYIYYNERGESKAKELWDIAEKYGGYLSYEATAEETRRIGQLLDYKESDIEDFIRKNYF
jgi:hypothetical protein